MGVAGYFVSIIAQVLGTKYSTVAMSSLINSMNPIFTIVFAAIFLKEKFTVKKAVSLAVALAGTYIILGGGSGGQVLGVVFSFVSVTVWSMTCVSARKVTQKYDPIQITLYGITIASVLTVPVAAGELILSEAVQWEASMVLPMLFIGVVGMGLPHYCWNKSLSILEAGTCSMFYPLQALIATALGAVFLKESVTPNYAIGALMIMVGIVCGVLSTHPGKSRVNN